MKGKEFVVDYHEIYPSNTLVFAGVDKCDVIKKMQSYLGDDLDLSEVEKHINPKFSSLHFFPCGKMVIFFKDEQPSVGIIAHEALHVVERIMEYIGNGDVPVNETWNYLLEYIVNKIYNELF